MLPTPTEESPEGIHPVADLRAENEKKGSTARIELPQEVRLPQPQTYHIKIKRTGEPSANGGGSLPQGFHSPNPKRGGLFGSRG